MQFWYLVGLSCMADNVGIRDISVNTTTVKPCYFYVKLYFLYVNELTIMSLTARLMKILTMKTKNCRKAALFVRVDN